MKDSDIFERRLKKHHDELRWLYMELYDNDAMFAELCDQMYAYHLARNQKMKMLAQKREKNPAWFRRKDMLGMMLYIDNFAGTIQGLQKKLSYLEYLFYDFKGEEIDMKEETEMITVSNK